MISAKEDRIRTAIAMGRPDQIPFAMWTHLPDADRDAQTLADASWQFYQAIDSDLIKTMDNGMYATEDFGVEIDESEVIYGGKTKVVRTPVQSWQDWQKIQPLNIADAPVLQRELKALQLVLAKARPAGIPVVFTVFSPLTTADKLSNGHIVSDIHDGHGAAAKAALESITVTTENLVREAISLGASGIYFASQLSSIQMCDEATYRQYGVPYDLRVIKASQGWCNVLHAHGKQIMFDLLKDYPVQIFNWHAFESKPTLEGAKAAGKCIMGGLVREDITHQDLPAVSRQIKECLDCYHGAGHIFSAGCVIRYPVNISFIQQVKEELKRQAQSQPSGK